MIPKSRLEEFFDKPVAPGLFWGWLAILLIFNVIPLGSDINRSLNTNRFILRLDYLVHLLTLLAFAGVYIWGRFRGQSIFPSNELLKFGTITIVAVIGLELIQILIPYRAYNPWDLISNLAGAVIALGLAMLAGKNIRHSSLGSAKMVNTVRTDQIP